MRPSLLLHYPLRLRQRSASLSKSIFSTSCGFCQRKFSVLASDASENKSGQKQAGSRTVKHPASLTSMLNFLSNRGIIDQTFPLDGVEEALEKTQNSRCVYAGFDPTAESLHLGHLVILTALLHFYAAGWDVVVLLGGATARVGDPSGLLDSRPVVEQASIDSNLKRLYGQIDGIFANFAAHFLPPTNPPQSNGSKSESASTSDSQRSQKMLGDVHILDNCNWYDDMKLLDFLTGTGREVTIQHMLRKHLVKERLDTPNAGMTFAEFSYQVMQGMDWQELYQGLGCSVQIGGSDQLGNIATGHKLIRRLQHADEHAADSETATTRYPFGLCTPLLTSDDGSKLSKSTTRQKPIPWLSPDLTSPFEFYQHLRRVPDPQIAKYLSLLTFYPTEQLKGIVEKHRQKPELWHAQQHLAEQVTLLVHGPAGLSSAQQCTNALFKSDFEALGSLTPEQIAGLGHSFDGVVDLTYDPGLTLIELCRRIKCFTSDQYAEQVITAGGLYVNFIRIKDPGALMVKGTHILPNLVTLLRVGKRQHYLVCWSMDDRFSDVE